MIPPHAGGPHNAHIMKPCYTCNTEKPETEFYSNRSKHDGLDSRCKVCAKAAASAYVARDPERRKAYFAGYYATNADHIKATSAAWAAAHPERVKEIKVTCAVAHAERYNAAQRARYAANPEPFNAITRAWQKANPERVRASQNAWNAANPERLQARRAAWKEANSERISEVNAAYVEANRERLVASCAARRAAKRNACPAWADHEKIVAVYALAQQMTKDTGILHSVDHMVPLKSKLVCGLHVEHNLEVLTLADNSGKCNHWWPDMP